ncbi:dynein regulatory complex subunit 4 [Coccinella septempunctata]|uniref:dynein regulatory complex subunit 4 n=1 Tax=Coccinella septempunctata TaxID=41139 RepID=UPI001D076F4B|nr:dynein regulatory complex subunit 4 [Coccinella septempunctata]
MPPKKKGGGKSTVIDGVDTSSMTREQLEVFCLRIKEENEREREERNFFQLERDKLRTFWEITRNELEEARAKIRNKERQIEENTEKNEEILKFYKQKVKHLQYEHENDLTECKAESLVSLKRAADNHLAQEKELLADKIALKNKAQEQELNHQDQVRNLKLQHSEEISKARSDFDGKSKELELKFERKFSELTNELNLKHSMEIAEIEERKNTQLNALTKQHDEAYSEMKMYYNDITLNNLALISSLKEQMEVLRKQNERMSKQVADLMSENKKMVEPLSQARAEVIEYRRQLTNYEKDKISLENTKIKLGQTRKEFEDLKWANEALEIRFAKLQAEHQELKRRFNQAVLEVQQKTSLKNVLLEKRVRVLGENLEQKDALIEDLVVQLKDPQHAVKTNKKLEDILNKKNATINDLQYELARVCKAHDDLLDTYEEKLHEYGIPKIELGFIPLRTVPEGQGGLPKGPAGLVTKNR